MDKTSVHLENNLQRIHVYPHRSGHDEYIWSQVREFERSVSEEEATRGTTPLSRATVWLREDQHTNCIQYFITILTARLYRWL